MWSKIKALLRGLAARTQQELSAAITRAFDAVTPADVRGWFFFVPHYGISIVICFGLFL